MTQENGMPIRFQLRANNKIVGYEKALPLPKCGWIYSTDNRNWSSFFIPHTEKDQAIGVTDSSDPPQELYLGDLIGFNLDKKDVIGEIIWLNFSVWVRLWRNENTLSYLSMSHVLDYFKIKKLGSRYDLKMKEIWKKAGLE